MRSSVKTIRLPLPFRTGNVNAYLFRSPAGYTLIDAGLSGQRFRLEEALVTAGVKPGELNLILLTHGDFDHTGGAGYLRGKFGAKIAMHPKDAGMAEFGDMFWNRNAHSVIINKLAAFLFGFFRSDRFTPDILLEDGQDLSAYGFPGQVLSTPGHSSGSICFLADEVEVDSGRRKQPGAVLRRPAGQFREAAGSQLDR